MWLTSKFNKGNRFLLSFIDIFSKYAWVISVKDKKGITITKAFQEILHKSSCNPNKILVDKESEFYNSSMKSWLKNNNIEMYSTHNEGKLVVAEKFIRVLKKKTNIWYQYQKKCVYW